MADRGGGEGGEVRLGWRGGGVEEERGWGGVSLGGWSAEVRGARVGE